ncbi:M949_RS01915 family surface polysaccharide biosynthesis protein [uncultured Flavobacterium sp.]|uniref:M949_RS01915 family surface polysaccharide biosynthesis protein n=1 Tax=uncultured Flavobacterium sp. TaxID=165435 RepID=UPI0025F6605E|nr:hypothetical protein [uncultured Flavobacterium sp.]
MSAQAQTYQKVDVKKLPEGIRYEGVIRDAISYIDKSGDNIVIITETGAYSSTKFKHENEGEDAELFAYHYNVKNGVVHQTWKMYDYQADCPFDMELVFLSDTFQITDLDGNGISEVWVIYKNCCSSDVSPCSMKIIMHEGSQKFAMRGSNKVFIGFNSEGVKEYFGGEYTFDAAFRNGKKKFRDFAMELWGKNIMQKWYDGQ